MDSRNSGGVGIYAEFPDFVDIENIEEIIGTYVNANIERLELEAIIQGLDLGLRTFKEHKNELSRISKIVVVTDRKALSDSERTNAYKIKAWRKNGWKNHEGKPIKNSDLLNKLDKKRFKLNNESYKMVSIEFRRRKYNRKADKLSKVGRKRGLENESISIKGIKIGKRKFDGSEISYSKLQEKETLHVNIFKKDPVKDEWEVSAEICSGIHLGKKLKIYVDDKLQSKLMRGNEFLIRLKHIHTYHVRIYRTLKKLKKKKKVES